MPRILLASTSPSRRELLVRAGLDPVCRRPMVDESAYTPSDPGDRALARARAKADALPVEPGWIGIAADQVAFDPDEGVCFGKPADDAAQLDRLLSLRGRPHALHTAWVAYTTDQERAGVEVATIHMARTDREELAAYVATGEARGCAGGYAVEGRGAFLVDRIEGDWTGVLGLPLYRVLAAVRALGWRFGG
jgi:septum formation protein